MNYYDLDIMKGTDYSLSLNLTNSDGSPIDLSNCSISGYLKFKYSDSPTGKLASLGPLIVNATGGSISLSISNSGTDNLPSTLGVYDINIYKSGVVTNVLAGRARIYPNVTF